MASGAAAISRSGSGSGWESSDQGQKARAKRLSARANASLVFRDTEAKWRITAGVNNLTDETYQVAGNSSLSTGSGYAEVAYARPREWFVNVQFDF